MGCAKPYISLFIRLFIELKAQPYSVKDNAGLYCIPVRVECEYVSALDWQVIAEQSDEDVGHRPIFFYLV